LRRKIFGKREIKPIYDMHGVAVVSARGALCLLVACLAVEMAAGFAACGVGRNAPIHAGLRRGVVRRELVTMMAKRRKGVVKENSVNPYVVLGVPREVSFPLPRLARVTLPPSSAR